MNFEQWWESNFGIVSPGANVKEIAQIAWEAGRKEVMKLSEDVSLAKSLKSADDSIEGFNFSGFKDITKFLDIADRLKELETAFGKIKGRRCTSPTDADSACECCQHHWHYLENHHPQEMVRVKIRELPFWVPTIVGEYLKEEEENKKTAADTVPYFEKLSEDRLSKIYELENRLAKNSPAKLEMGKVKELLETCNNLMTMQGYIIPSYNDEMVPVSWVLGPINDMRKILRDIPISVDLIRKDSSIPVLTDDMGWERHEEEKVVTCHSRMVGGVLCRWWGDSQDPPGVAMINSLFGKSKKISWGGPR